MRILLLTIFLLPLSLHAGFTLTPELYLSYAIPVLLLLILFWAINKAYKIWKNMNEEG